MNVSQAELSHQGGLETLDQQRRGARLVNVGATERWLSLLLGGGFFLSGFRRGSNGIFSSVLGGALICRGVTGYSPLYRILGIDTSEARPRRSVSVPHGRGVKVESSIIINKTPEELYQFWRRLENLPRVMSNIEAVQTIDDKRSRWVMKTLGGAEVSWESEIINEVPNELIAWRSINHSSDVDHAGSVRFEQAQGAGGTIVKVSLEYRPPAGIIGVGLAKLFGEEPQQLVDKDLRRFKELMERGDVSMSQGQGFSSMSNRAT